MKTETIEEKTYRLLKWIYGAQPSFKSIKGTNDFKLRCAMIEMAIAEEREANALIVESLVKHEKQPSVMRMSINQALVFAAIKIRSNGGDIPLSVFPFAPKDEVSE